VTAPPTYADEEGLRDRLTTAMEEWCEPLREAGIDYEARLVDGAPAETLMRVSEETKADLLIVGRRGHGGFAEMALGSVPHTLSHHAGVPVVIVPSDG
jgi:nucleotide-binding universal stress UspA family protein